MSVLGVDIGGTKIAAALVDPGRGTHGPVTRIPTGRTRDPAAVLADVVALADDLAPAGTPIGIGLCEFVDPDGRPASDASIDWRTTDVAGALAHVGPCRIDSDVRTAARAEARFGAGRGRSSFLYVTVGTGISQCLVIDGVPWAGAHGAAIGLGAPLVEATASGTGLARVAGRGSAEEVLADPELEAVVAAGAADLGREIAALVNAVDPECVVVGGGLGMVPGYRDRVAHEARAVLEVELRDLPFLPAEPGAHAGVVGAGLVAPA